MRAHLSLHQRALLARWLQSRDEWEPHSLRSLVAEHDVDPLDAATTRQQHKELRRRLDALRGVPCTLDHEPPIGRGQASLDFGGLRFDNLSPWELAWLEVDRHLTRQSAAHTAAAFTSRLTRRFGSPLNALALAVLCQPTPEDASLVAAQAADGLDASIGSDFPWIRWLAGKGPPPRSLPASSDSAPDEEFEDTEDTDAIDGIKPALAGSWPAVDRALPAKHRGYTRTVRLAQPETMDQQMLGQLSLYAQKKKPSPKILEGSLRCLFSHWGHKPKSPWWSGTNVAHKLPLAALYRHLVEPELPPARLLHRLREQNPHLLTPPARTFTAPPEVLEAMEIFEAMLRKAADAGEGAVRWSLDDGAVRFVPASAGRRPPAA